MFKKYKMWQCDYCAVINEYNNTEQNIIICKNCNIEDKFLVLITHQII